MRRKQNIEAEEVIEIPATEPEAIVIPEPVKQPEPEPVRRNIFNQVIKPIVGGIGSGAAR